MPGRPSNASSRIEREKKLAAESAAQLVEPGMRLGLGTGSTVAYLLPVLAARRLDIRCVATSPRTEAEARRLGLLVEPFASTGAVDSLDLAIDGADAVAPDRWLTKGGGGAHTREKVVAVTARRFAVIVSSDKLVERLVPPVPLELMRFGIASTLRRLGSARVRNAEADSPDGGVIADWLDPFDDPAALAAHLDSCPGVVAHGLFEPALVSDVITGSAG